MISECISLGCTPLIQSHHGSSCSLTKVMTCTDHLVNTQSTITVGTNQIYKAQNVIITVIGSH